VPPMTVFILSILQILLSCQKNYSCVTP